MTTPATSPRSLAPAADDYTYAMRVGVPVAQIVEAVTDDAVIQRWWTAATSSERRGDDVQLFMGDGVPFVRFTVDDGGEGEVTWRVTECIVEDWVGTTPTFSIRTDEDGTCAIEFRHVGLRPALECFDMCRAGWNHFMPSLHQFLETGVGRPNEPRDPS